MRKGLSQLGVPSQISLAPVITGTTFPAEQLKKKLDSILPFKRGMEHRWSQVTPEILRQH